MRSAGSRDRSLKRGPHKQSRRLTQISAIQAALDKVALGLFGGHARHCMREGAADGRADEMASERMAAVGRLMKRG